MKRILKTMISIIAALTVVTGLTALVPMKAEAGESVTYNITGTVNASTGKCEFTLADASGNPIEVGAKLKDVNWAVSIDNTTGTETAQVIIYLNKSTYWGNCTFTAEPGETSSGTKIPYGATVLTYEGYEINGSTLEVYLDTPVHDGCTELGTPHYYIVSVDGDSVVIHMYSELGSDRGTFTDSIKRLNWKVPIIEGRWYYWDGLFVSLEGTIDKPVKTRSSSYEHVHNYVYTVLTVPTEDYDGEAAEVCSCGDSKNHTVLPAIDVIMANRLRQIDSAKAGQTITLKMGTLNSLPNWFMGRIAEKNDLNFKLQFEYEHINYELSIPRGTSVDLTEAWYGPECLMSLYDTEQLD